MLEDEKEEVGPLAKLQSLWQELPVAATDQPDAVAAGCERMREYVVQFRKKVEPRFLNLATTGRGGNGQGGGSTVLIMWKNVQYATHRMTFDPGQLQVEGEPMPVPLDVSNEPNADGEFGPGRTVPVINTPDDPDLFVPAGTTRRATRPRSPNSAASSPIGSTWKSAAGTTTTPSATAAVTSAPASTARWGTSVTTSRSTS